MDEVKFAIVFEGAEFKSGLCFELRKADYCVLAML